MDSHTLCYITANSVGTCGALLLIRTKPVSIRKVLTTSTALIPYGPVYSTVGLRLNR